MVDIINTDNISDNRFWLQIMGDYARFIFNALSPAQTAEAKETQKFIREFDGLLGESRQELTKDQLTALNQRSYDALQNFRKYILQIAQLQLTGKIIFSLRPSYINHMVNDTEQYLYLLTAYKQNKAAVLNSAAVSMVWLMNIYVSAITIQDGLDATSFDRSKQNASNLAGEMLDLYFKAYVMNGLCRTGLCDFPALTSLNDDIAIVMLKYAEFLVEQINLMEEKKVLGNLTMLYLDSMYRQLCYYINELSKVSSIKPPACDPFRQRREE